MHVCIRKYVCIYTHALHSFRLNVDRDAYKIRALGAALIDSEQERMTKKAEMEFREGLLTNFAFEVVDMKADGNCLFRTFAHQIYGDQEKSVVFRRPIALRPPPTPLLAWRICSRKGVGRAGK